MNLRSILMASTVAAGTALVGAPAMAGTCPNTVGLSPPANTAGVATTCNLIIHFNAQSGISTTTGPQANYDGVEDALIGVINHSGGTLSGFHITSTTNVFGFDGDGITAFLTGNFTANDGSDSSGYGGPMTTFSNIGVGCAAGTFCGDVSFTGGLANGASTYFSLEEPISLTHAIVITPTPEPASMALLGAGLVGMALLRRRRRR
jgi:hypothetical protein